MITADFSLHGKDEKNLDRKFFIIRHYQIIIWFGPCMNCLNDVDIL